MRKLNAVLVAGFVVVASACQVQNPVSPGYPCGTQGLVCSNKMCCWQGDVCGGDDPTCPANYCCWVGPPPYDPNCPACNDEAKKRVVAKHPNIPQWKPSAS